MINPSIDKLLTKVDNKYELAILTAKRARELYEGSDSMIEQKYINHLTTSINELDQNKIKTN